MLVPAAMLEHAGTSTADGGDAAMEANDPAGSGPWLLRHITSAAGLVLKLVVAVAILTLARATFADEYEVPTGSMWPTIQPGDRILVDKTAYGLRLPFSDRWLVERRGPTAGEVVVFGDPRGGV